MPSLPDVALLALVYVSSVSMAHTLLRPWMPNERPLACGFCLTLWLAMGVASYLRTTEAGLAIPVAGFLALIVAGQWPWVFYSKSE